MYFDTFSGFFNTVNYFVFLVAAVVRCIYLYCVQVIPNPFLVPPSPPGCGWGICGGEILVKALTFHHGLGHKNNNYTFPVRSHVVSWHPLHPRASC